MARPAGLEPAPFCLEAVRTTLPNLARGVANRTNSASWIDLMILSIASIRGLIAGNVPAAEPDDYLRSRRS